MNPNKTRIEICRSCTRRRGFLDERDSQALHALIEQALDPQVTSVTLEQCQRLCPEDKIVVAIQKDKNQLPVTTFADGHSAEELVEEIKRLL